MLLRDDTDLIRELVDLLPLTKRITVADIGAGIGITAATVLDARPEQVGVITVDVNPEAILAVSRGISPDRVQDWWGIVADSAAAARLLSEHEFDLIMLDTSHTYEDTVAELRAWLPLLSDSGYLWLHDYVCLGEHPSPEMAQPPCLRGEPCGWCGQKGVSRAVDQFVRDGYLATYRVAGLGWSGQLAMARQDLPW